MKVKVFVIFLGFWLLSALAPSHVPLVQASDVLVSEASSPEWVWRWDNPWTLTAYRDGVANSTFFPTPQVFWNGTHWVDYVYEEHEDYYLLRNSHIAVEVYDYYTKFYDVNYSEVRLYDERWEVQRWRPKQGMWDDIGAQPGTPIFTVVTNSSGVWLTKFFISWAGVLNITYALKVASPLKHTVTWKSFIAEETEFRVVQKWSGIVGGRVKHAQGEENVMGPVTVNSTWFWFMKLNGTFTILEDFWDTGFLDENRLYDNYVLQPTTIDVHAQGMKADFTFQNSTMYTISQNETITLDPTTSTFISEATKDGEIRKIDPFYPPESAQVDISGGWMSVGQTRVVDGSEDWYIIWRSYVSFSTSSIPNNASILNATLKLKTEDDFSYVDFDVRVMGARLSPPAAWPKEQQPIYGPPDTLEADDWDCGVQITTWNTENYPGDNIYINITVSTDQINKVGRTQFALRSSRDGIAPTRMYTEHVTFHTGDSSSNNEPKLEVIWELMPAEMLQEIDGKIWYYWNASNDKAAIVLFGAGASTSALLLFDLYANEEWTIYKERFVRDLHANGFDVLANKRRWYYEWWYEGDETWMEDATMWLKEQGYQDISLFGFSGGGVVVANEIQKDYAGIWHAAVLASAPVDWEYHYGIFQSAHTASQAKVPTSFITSPDDSVANDGGWTIYEQMETYYNNMVVHKEWHSWNGRHAPFAYTCRNHTGETVVEVATNWYLKVFDVAVTGVSLRHYYRDVGYYFPLLHPGVYPTFTDPIIISVTVKNEGDFGETFNVTAYNNTSPIGTRTVTNLAPGAKKTLTFTWEPYLPGYPDNRTEAWPYPTYTFSAEASVVPGETDTDDNTYVDDTVTVKWPGDADGDGHVYVLDQSILGANWRRGPRD